MLSALTFFVSAMALLVTTRWLLRETSEEIMPANDTRMRTVPAAAMRGRWPELRSAQWYRRLIRIMLITAAIGACSFVARLLLTSS